ncbi:NDR1/HIN1-like protein 13 [Rutidosis leptorrhynchoides]|uniref:NDR1/HIN1-like protein 13 n=1 Tax=Rutidosis leptorrhynchoides TaxID=125765 RepID=UPI003A993534
MTAADHPHNDSDRTQPPPDAVKPPPPTSDVKPLLPEATYVIQIPKDQIYRIPPPENERKIQKLANRKPRRSLCCRCLCYTISASLILLILLAIAAAVVYFVYWPEKVKYSVDNISVSGVNLTSSSPVSPQLTVGIRFENPNDKITLFYAGKGSSVNVYYDDVHLCNGVLPAFEQKANNVTVIQTALKGSDIVLSRDVHARLVKQEKGQNVPLKLNVKAPVKVKIGAVKKWEITVSVSCDMIVDRLTQKSKIMSKNCDYSVKLW